MSVSALVSEAVEKQPVFLSHDDVQAQLVKWSGRECDKFWYDIEKGHVVAKGRSSFHAFKLYGEDICRIIARARGISCDRVSLKVDSGQFAGVIVNPAP